MQKIFSIFYTFLTFFLVLVGVLWTSPFLFNFVNSKLPNLTVNKLSWYQLLVTWAVITGAVLLGGIWKKLSYSKFTLRKEKNNNFISKS